MFKLNITVDIDLEDKEEAIKKARRLLFDVLTQEEFEETEAVETVSLTRHGDRSGANLLVMTESGHYKNQKVPFNELKKS